MPRRLLLVRTGNIRNADLLGLFEQHMPAIDEAFDEADLVELTTDELVVHKRSSGFGSGHGESLAAHAS